MECYNHLATWEREMCDPKEANYIHIINSMNAFWNQSTGDTPQQLAQYYTQWSLISMYHIYLPVVIEETLQKFRTS